MHLLVSQQLLCTPRCVDVLLLRHACRRFPLFLPPAGDAADSHPRALRLLPAHAGCLIKAKVKPVRRHDGDEGHTESSRPTPEIAPPSADALRNATARAAAIAAAAAAAAAF